jgi:hypothetical protein
MTRRPLSVTAVSLLYIVTGGIGLVYHADRHPLGLDFVWIEAVRLAAVVLGVYLLRGHNWARWGAIAWMAYHAILGAFHDATQFAVHVLFLVVVSYCLFRPPAAGYFRAARRE